MSSAPHNKPSADGRFSRRQMVAIAASAAALSGAAVKLGAQASPSPTDFDQAARESHRSNSATLAEFDIPQSLEPAFQFKA